MIDYGNFDLVFGDLSPFPLTRQWAQQVEKKRKEHDGLLFLDRVLGALNLPKAIKSYPPKTDKDLRQIHQLITDAPNVAVHHKLSILYYLLLDIDARHSETTGHATTQNGRAEVFAIDAAMPQNYSIFMSGLWHMDSGSNSLALKNLTHPSLIPEFADEIITALSRASRDNDDASAVLAYYYAVQPVLRTSSATALLFDAIANSSIPEALHYARARPVFMHEQLFKRLVLSIVESSRDEETAERAFELTSSALDPQEEEWFREALLGSEGKKSKVSKDTLLMRRIAQGDAGTVSEKGAWASVLEGFKQGSGDRGAAQA